jgi:hypothetical protein
MYLLVTEPLAWPTRAATVHLCKTEIVGDVREAVTKNVRSHIGQLRALEDMLPVVRERCFDEIAWRPLMSRPDG